VTSAADADSPVLVGQIAGAYGVRGWVRLMSFTDPPENLIHYAPWSLSGPGSQRREVRLVEWRWHGDRLVGRLEGIDDRDAALAINGAQISVPRTALPAAADGTWYWADLIGSEVVNLEGTSLGRLADVMDNGAQDVMVLHADGGRERLVPFVRDVFVKEIDPASRRITVDWAEDY
jgi:16S rRNA processing protein RimM